MEKPTPIRCLDHFAFVHDPRGPNLLHRLFDIFVMALCAVISGAEGWGDKEEYGRAQADWFRQFLALPHGNPSAGTFRRVLSRLDPEEITRCFVNWTESLRECADGDRVAIDGKIRRRFSDHAANKGAIPCRLGLLDLSLSKVGRGDGDH